ncbi:p53-like transcription factor [Cucurbitaria berberidis CBS 394.84]|uniref:P53-like transcription factor n=1 Tax=Cucurbitaria berberidis CBS 394.84 TaxID=1168544 RepID=A0A9P4L6X6_9PLEO|nr:p53-like transcription factor [Cucurbitaria berberidis CBS 394.84]KAF1843548.1 p53-like transcription factor [Cucurbitaria berberidis CBS 394.84]
MNSVLQPPLPLASDNPFSSEQQCIDHIGAHAHHSSFAAGVPDQLRRDGALAHSTGIPLTSRYGAPRPDTAYQPGAAHSDSSGSISTSPSSNGSSALAYSYSSFPPTVATTYSNQYPLANNYSSFACGYGNMSTRRMSSLHDNSSSAMLPPSRSPGLGNSVSPSMGTSARDNYTTATPGLHRHPHTLSPRSDIPRYNALPETPRSVLPTTMPMTPYGAYPSSTYPGHANAAETPPFNSLETYGTITCEGTAVTPSIDAKIEKGFFFSSDSVWTCYRRNYFAVNVSFGLSPWISNARLYLDQGGGKQQEQIQSMAVSLSAAVDGTTGKTIELIQHTPKRDKGPQLAMKKELLAPTPPGKSHEHGYGLSSFHQTSTVPGPQLPLQNENDSSQQYSPTSHANSNYQHSFERIQFKSATANNGKRRAQQQYYHLIVELWANIQNPRDSEPRWVKIACRSSHPVVVRGRSPSHYQNEGPHNASTSRGAPGSGLGGPSHHGLGSNGRTSYSSYSNGMSGGGSTGMGGSMYRGNTYSLDPSPVGSHSVSSASSLSGGPVEGLVGDQHMVDDDDVKMMEAPHDYSYYPTPIYEGIPPKLDTTLPLPERRIKEEYPGPAAIAAGWQVGGCGRFQGIETSRGYYPDVHTHVGY